MSKMLQIVFMFLAAISISHTLPLNDDGQAKIIVNEYKFENEGPGTYYFRFVTSDGTERNENGINEGEGKFVVTGYYSFLDPQGKKHYVNYVADNTGYHPTIPKSPPMSTSGSPYSGIPPSAVATLLG